jgi:hypothetical protein
MSDTPLIVADTAIRQDTAGRFSLNDLHRAAGGAKRHQPSDWLRLQQTQELLSELETPGNPGVSETTGIPVVSIEGRAGGTFVAKELVYAYAMWISPAFHLKVIRAYDAMVTAPAAVTPEAVTRLLDLLQKGLAAEQGKPLPAPAPTKKPRPKMANMHVLMPADLHHRLRQRALERRQTAREFVIDAVSAKLGEGA